MTSKLNRERLQEIAEDGFLKHGESKELARMVLAAMDSEPYGFTDGDRRGMIYKPEHSDRLSEPVPVYRHAQTAPEYPETLPCPVLLEPGLRFGKGIKTSTMLAALARRAVHESDMAALSQEERAEFQARIEDFKALIAQPVPVVSADLLHTAASAIEDLLTTQDRTGAGVWFDLPFRLRSAANAQPAPVELANIALPHSWLDGEGVEVMSANEVKRACRAAMLAAATQPQNAQQNIPEIIPGWIPVSERMPEIRKGWLDIPVIIAVLGEKDGAEAMYFSDGKFRWGRDEPPIEDVTHWMLLPAAPKEVKGE